jgi:protein-disulfide isomerase
MAGIRVLMVLIILIVPLFVGCMGDEKADEAFNKRLDDLEKGQTDILAMLDAAEVNQKELMKLIKSGSQARPAAQAKPSIDYNKVHNIPIANSPIRGNAKALITVVEFSDFECPYCSKLQPTLKQVLEAYQDKVRLVYKEFPLSFHKQAKNASKAALAAREQGTYWEMHDLIFKDYNKLNEEKFKEYAVKLGLDMERFMKDFKSDQYDAQILRDIKLGTSIGVRGTPSLFMNGKRMGARSFDAFKTLIEGYLKK